VYSLLTDYELVCQEDPDAGNIWPWMLGGFCVSLRCRLFGFADRGTCYLRIVAIGTADIPAAR